MLENYTPTRFMAATSHYDKEKADRAVNFIECLKHSKGQWAGQQFKLLEWQERLVRDIFGTIKPNGYRQFTQAYVEVPKKNGKSALSSTLALYLLCADGEEGAEIYSCAGDRQQASIVYNGAVEMVKQCPALAKRMKILASTKRLVYLPTNSYYQVLSAETGTKHGFSAHGVIFDELHVQKTREFFDIMTKGSGDARRQPLFFYITTAGNNTHSICYEVHQKAMDIIEGRKVDPTFFPLIYGAKEDEDWTSPEVWAKANPSFILTQKRPKVSCLDLPLLTTFYATVAAFLCKNKNLQIKFFLSAGFISQYQNLSQLKLLLDVKRLVKVTIKFPKNFIAVIFAPIFKNRSRILVQQCIIYFVIFYRQIFRNRQLISIPVTVMTCRKSNGNFFDILITREIFSRGIRNNFYDFI